MKKSFLTFVAMAFVLSFTSCKDVPAETTAETEAEVSETIAPTAAEISEKHTEEVVDSTSTDTLVKEPATNSSK